jgi:hypothetical protein
VEKEEIVFREQLYSSPKLKEGVKLELNSFCFLFSARMVLQERYKKYDWPSRIRLKPRWLQGHANLMVSYFFFKESCIFADHDSV